MQHTMKYAQNVIRLAEDQPSPSLSQSPCDMRLLSWIAAKIARQIVVNHRALPLLIITSLILLAQPRPGSGGRRDAFASICRGFGLHGPPRRGPGLKPRPLPKRASLDRHGDSRIDA